MALTTTNAQISLQDGPLAPVNLTSGITLGLFTPGAAVTFALQNTAGIQRAEYTLICPNYPGLHQSTFVWTQGQVNAFVVQMPANTFVSNPATMGGILVNVVVTDGNSSIASAYNYLQSKGDNGLLFQHYADYVVNNALPAYTNTNGVLVGNANGAITSTMADSVTPAVGDVFFLPPGIAVGATDVGLYAITAVGAAGAKFTAVQAPDWQQGSLVLPKCEILVGKGASYIDTTWVNTTAGMGNIIGVATFTFFPRCVVQQITLSASGNIVVANVPLMNTVQCGFAITRKTVGGTTTNTVMYNLAAAPTGGNLGTATFTVQASVAAGTANTADQSVLQLATFNQV